MQNTQKYLFKICLIIPCYNEEKRIDLEKFVEFSQSNSNISFLFVNDGSQDNTAQVIENICQKNLNLTFLNLLKNAGKAEAVRQGALSLIAKIQKTKNDIHYDYIGYWDADLATPLSELNAFQFALNRREYNLIMGSRIRRLGGEIVRKWYRHLLGRIFATTASIILKIPVYDTQCGAKIFKVNLVEQIFKEKFISYWIFDVEILFRLKKISPKLNAYEVPLSNWEDIGGSKLKLLDFCKAPLEMYNIYRKYK